MKLPAMLKHPSAFLPVLMSLGALATLEHADCRRFVGAERRRGIELAGFHSQHVERAR
jgi:hypothetical protein